MIVIPTFMIVPPAIFALAIYMWMYYELDPPNRLSDPRMALAIACFLVIVGQMVVVVQGYNPVIPSLVLFLLSVGLLICAIRMRARESGPELRARLRR